MITQRNHTYLQLPLSFRSFLTLGLSLRRLAREPSREEFCSCSSPFCLLSNFEPCLSFDLVQGLSKSFVKCAHLFRKIPQRTFFHLHNQFYLRVLPLLLPRMNQQVLKKKLLTWKDLQGLEEVSELLGLISW